MFEPKDTHKPASKPNIKIAICYWGLIRTLREVFPSQQKYVYSELDAHGIEYDTYIHTWITDKNIVWNIEMEEPIDYDSVNVINPVAKQLDYQDEFSRTINMSDYYYENTYEWEQFLIRNHLCALESQKRCAELCFKSGKKYDYVMFLRPDALINKRLPVEAIFGEHFSDTTIIIPNYNHWEGWNDQFAIMPYHLVKPYSHRINGIIDFRKTNGRIVSEKYVKYVIDLCFSDPLQIDFHFDLLRPNGKLNGNI